MPEAVSDAVVVKPGLVADAPSNPAIVRALERRAMAHKPRVQSQLVVGELVISKMSDGSKVTGKVVRATSARLTPSGRDLRDAEVRALAARLGVDATDDRAVAFALQGHRGKLNTLETEAKKSQGKAGALGALAGLALGAAATAAAKKKG
jgi:hypothetical protein